MIKEFNFYTKNPNKFQSLVGILISKQCPICVSIKRIEDYVYFVQYLNSIYICGICDGTGIYTNNTSKVDLLLDDLYNILYNE